MIFPSHVFLIAFLPAVLVGWYLLRPVRFRLLFLASASYVFYAGWDYRFAALMFGSTLLDYYCGWKIHCTKTIGKTDPPDHSARRARRWLALSVIANLSTLGFFKYFNFFATSLADLLSTVGLHASPATLDIVLPIGISFYTFQSMSYTIDVYRGNCRATSDVVRLFAYVSLFPQLVAGPIVRYTEMESQFDKLEGRPPVANFAADGVWLFTMGMVKKVWIADTLAPLVGLAFDRGSPVQLATAWVGAIAYAFQLYFDFSGYSDMARGLGLMLGFEFPINFNSPYKSANISEFWNRWHITLSNWLRDYLYIPLGGSRTTRLKTMRNLTITMFLGGLWHGAAWHYVAWGLFHGALLSAHALWKQATTLRLPRPICVGATFLMVVLGWVLFRSHSLGHAVTMYSAMIGLNGLEPLTYYSHTLGAHLPELYGRVGGMNGVVALLALVGCVFVLPNSQDAPKPRHPLFAAALPLVVIATMTTFVTESPFLYYQF